MNAVLKLSHTHTVTHILALIARQGHGENPGEKVARIPLFRLAQVITGMSEQRKGGGSGISFERHPHSDGIFGQLRQFRAARERERTWEALALSSDHDATTASLGAHSLPIFLGLC